MPHSKCLSQVFQVRFWCYKKQICFTHRVYWEDDLKIQDDLKNEDNLKNEDDLKYEDDLKNENDLKNEADLKIEDDLKNWPIPQKHLPPSLPLKKLPDVFFDDFSPDSPSTTDV